MEFKGVKIDWPLDRNIIRRGSESNTFGMVRMNIDHSPRAHQGWDFFAPVGTPCYAIADGVVMFNGDAGALGNLLVISINGTGAYAAYAHLSHIDVVKGQTVARGQVAGATGCTGNAQGMSGLDEHLHFEIRETPLPGLGLKDRMSPIKVFGFVPLHSAVSRSGA